MGTEEFESAGEKVIRAAFPNEAREVWEGDDERAEVYRCFLSAVKGVAAVNPDSNVLEGGMKEYSRG